jgi:two-component system chemotaxis response regulator CheB
VKEAPRLSATVRPEIESRAALEVKIAAGAGGLQEGIMKLGQLSPFTCPECRGVLMRIDEEAISRFRCHTGHAYTDSVLLESIMSNTGEMLSQVQRSLEEGVLLLDEMGRQLAARGDAVSAKAFSAKARELERRSRAFHQAAVDNETFSAETVTESVAGKPDR